MSTRVADFGSDDKDINELSIVRGGDRWRYRSGDSYNQLESIREIRAKRHGSMITASDGASSDNDSYRVWRSVHK